MIVDSSAIVAVVLREPGFETVMRKLSAADSLAVGAPTLAEAGIVLSARLGTDARALLHGLLLEWEAETIPFGAEHWREAVSAFARFGKGRHKAQLNFGDCMSYAVARLADQPLLCTGTDFSKTDVRVA